jgi:arginyl-tRNA synthetase
MKQWLMRYSPATNTVSCRRMEHIYAKNEEGLYYIQYDTIRLKSISRSGNGSIQNIPG